MPTLQLKINNKYFNLACDEGQEENLKSAVDSLNLRLKEVYKSLPQATPDMALVVTALMMQDEILYKNSINSNTASLAELDNDYRKIATQLDHVSSYIEELALKFEKC